MKQTQMVYWRDPVSCDPGGTPGSSPPLTKIRREHSLRGVYPPPTPVCPKIETGRGSLRANPDQVEIRFPRGKTRENREGGEHRSEGYREIPSRWWVTPQVKRSGAEPGLSLCMENRLFLVPRPITTLPRYHILYQSFQVCCFWEALPLN